MLAQGALVAAILTAGTAPGTTWFVDVDARPGGDGLSWATAFIDLQDAMDSVLATDTVWVAAGTYRPDRATGNRRASFEIRNRVTVYGGFAGSETELDQRDPAINVTTLSGDLNGDDGPGFTNNEENSYNVVRLQMPASVGNVGLDGFVITAGNANGDELPFLNTGGVYYSAEGTNHFITIANCRFLGNWGNRGGGAFFWRGTAELIDCTFEDNFSVEQGGGIYTNATPLTLTRCDFIGNQTDESGGGLWVSDPLVMTDCTFLANVAKWSGGGAHAGFANSVTATNCTFESNEAAVAGPFEFGGEGGGLYLDASAELVRCRFLSNKSRFSGGGAWMDVRPFGRLDQCEFRGNESLMDDGGGLRYKGTGVGFFMNCLFVGNSAADCGGGACVDSTGGAQGRNFINCTFAGNTGGTVGGLFVPDGDDRVSNSILWANSDDGGSGEGSQISIPVGGVSHTCVQGWTGALGGLGNHGLDPGFENMNGLDGIPGTDDDNLRLQSGSPCIDAADNTVVPADVLDVDDDGDVIEPVSIDLAGDRRFVDDPSTPDTGVPDGLNPIVDMGAYEHQCPWDLDGDGDVGITDFLDLLSQWGTDPGGPPDFDGDGDVGITDFLELLANWGPCT